MLKTFLILRFCDTGENQMKQSSDTQSGKLRTYSLFKNTHCHEKVFFNYWLFVCLFDWSLTPLSTIFQLYRGGQLTIAGNRGTQRESHRPWAGIWQTLSRVMRVKCNLSCGMKSGVNSVLSLNWLPRPLDHPDPLNYR